MRKIIKAIVAGAALVALSSCVNEFTAEVGEIKFGVNTTYGNGPATKTEYSGKDQNNNSICSTSTKERINWLSTDKVRILCQQASRVSGSEKYDDYMIVLGAEGKAKANLSFTNDKGEFEPQAEASAEGSAYIVKASGSVEAKNDFGGIKVTGNAEVGVEGSIGFKTEDGKLTVKAGLTVFGGGEVELTVDYRKIGEKTAQAAKSTFEWIDSKMPWNW